jgi:flagellar motility protein MotE (MotC chaperone)
MTALKKQQAVLEQKQQDKNRELEEMKAKMKKLEENTETLLRLITQNSPNHIGKVVKLDEEKGTAELDLRVYRDKKAYSDAVETINKTGDWEE